MKKPKNELVPPDNSVQIRLLSAATDLFSRKGYAATTTREIVAAAGVTKPVLYYYFKNKEGIYIKLMSEAFTYLEGLLDASLKSRGSAKKKLLHLSDQVFTAFLENTKVARLMWAIYYGPHQGAPFLNFDAYHFKFHDAIRQLVKEGIRQKEFYKGKSEPMVWAIIGAVNVAMEVQLGHPEQNFGRKELKQVLNLILKGFEA